MPNLVNVLRQRPQTAMIAKFKSFARDEEGAASADLFVLSALVIGLGVMALPTLTNGATSAADKLEGKVSALDRGGEGGRGSIVARFGGSVDDGTFADGVFIAPEEVAAYTPDDDDGEVGASDCDNNGTVGNVGDGCGNGEAGNNGNGGESGINDPSGNLANGGNNGGQGEATDNTGSDSGTGGSDSGTGGQSGGGGGVAGNPECPAVENTTDPAQCEDPATTETV